MALPQTSNEHHPVSWLVFIPYRETLVQVDDLANQYCLEHLVQIKSFSIVHYTTTVGRDMYGLELLVSRE